MQLKLRLRISIIIVVTALANFAFGQEHPHWTYEHPDHWGELEADYAACGTGQAQSPINIEGEQFVDLTAVEFDYHPSAMHIFNSGHTIQVNYDAGSTITYNENTYELLQFHFHHPSEHTIHGETFPMEVHFVHRDSVGGLAVVGVMLTEGAENPAFAEIFANLPAEESEPLAETEIMVNAAAMLPTEHLYHTYRGSLTTPPCTEGVRWLLLTTPVELSAEQISAFRGIFEMNARPVQPLNQRDLLTDSAA